MAKTIASAKTAKPSSKAASKRSLATKKPKSGAALKRPAKRRANKPAGAGKPARAGKKNEATLDEIVADMKTVLEEGKYAWFWNEEAKIVYTTGITTLGKKPEVMMDARELTRNQAQTLLERAVRWSSSRSGLSVDTHDRYFTVHVATASQKKKCPVLHALYGEQFELLAIKRRQTILRNGRTGGTSIDPPH